MSYLLFVICWLLFVGCYIVSGSIGIVQTVNPLNRSERLRSGRRSQQSTSPDGATGIDITSVKSVT